MANAQGNAVNSKIKDPFRPINIHIDSAMDSGYVVGINAPFLIVHVESISDAIKAIIEHLAIEPNDCC